MAAKVNLSDAGFLVQHFQDQPTRWGVTSEVFKRHARFIHFIRETVDCRPDTGCVAARLVGLDGIKPSHLKDIISQTAIPYRAMNGVAVEWLALDPIRLERRLLSTITLKVWPSQQIDIAGPCVSPFSPLAMDVIEDLDKFLAASTAYRREKYPQRELELDAMCWWQEVLPSSLFGHCTEMLVLSALPRSALARLERGLALAPTESSPSRTGDAGAAGDLIDAAMISQGHDRSTALIETVLDILKESISEVDGINKRHWATEIQKLTNRAINAGPRTALLLSWSAGMCESGTIDETNPADSTVSAYIRRALLPLHRVLCALSDDLESADWQAINLRMLYQQLVASQSTGNQPTMRAALSNFHHFLVDWLDIEPLRGPLPGVTSSAPVRAQIVWEHELNLAMQWATQHEDARMGSAVQVILGIAHEAPARAQELTRLKLCNVSFSEDDKGKFAEIEIARHAASGRLKTPSSQRRLIVRSEMLLKLLSEWIIARKNQGAPESAFLFGDPSNDAERYRPAATLALAAQLLKTVTGDPKISIHTLRHAAISNLIYKAWLNTSETDVNRIEVVAAHAGHASGLTTLQIYSHRYEHALRIWLYEALRERIEISSQAAACLLSLKPDVLRKRASRVTQDVNKFAWNLLLQSTNQMSALRASLPFNWCTPIRPESTPSVNKQLTVGVMESILDDYLGGTTISTLARRFDLDEDALKATLAKLIVLCNTQAQQVFPLKAARRTNPVVTLAGSLAALGIDFDRGHQAKYTVLKNGMELKVEDSQLKRGLESWERCYQGTYLAIDKPQDILGVLALLRLCAVDSNVLRLCIQSTGVRRLPTAAKVMPITAIEMPTNRNIALLVENVKQVFESVFPFSPEVTLVSHTRDRPNAYLQWDSKSGGGTSGGATCGLSALMICVRAYLIQKGCL